MEKIQEAVVFQKQTSLEQKDTGLDAKPATAISLLKDNVVEEKLYSNCEPEKKTLNVRCEG